MIELTMRELMGSVDTLNEVVKRPLKAKAAFQFARICREVEKESSLFNEERDKLISQHYSKDENGENLLNEDGNPYIKFGTPEYEEFMKDITELLDNKISLNSEQIPIEDITDQEFTPKQMADLMPFMVE